MRHVLAIYVTSAVAIAAAAMVVQARAAFLIRELHPNFPRMVELAIYTPHPLYMAAHGFGVVGIVVVSALFASAVMFAIRKGKATLATVLASAHVVLLVVLLFLYAMSAVQLAGFVRVVMRR